MLKGFYHTLKMHLRLSLLIQEPAAAAADAAIFAIILHFLLNVRKVVATYM